MGERDFRRTESTYWRYRTRKPGPKLVDLEQLLGAGKELQQYVLDEVFGVGHAAGEAPGEPVKVLDLRSQQVLEVRLGGSGLAVQ
jgi:hypothetical protein